MPDTDWEARKRGDDCPLCAPRPDETDGMLLIATLSATSLYLNKTQTYRGASILVYDGPHRTRIDELDEAEWLRVAGDLYRAQRAIVGAVSPDHVNTESLGNIVPHLHFHIVPRTVDDARWGDPIWMTEVADMRDERIDKADLDALRHAVAERLDGV